MRKDPYATLAERYDWMKGDDPARDQFFRRLFAAHGARKVLGGQIVEALLELIRSLLFSLAGLSVLNTWGGTAGKWARRKINLDEIEIMIVACKSDEPRRDNEPSVG